MDHKLNNFLFNNQDIVLNMLSVYIHVCIFLKISVESYHLKLKISPFVFCYIYLAMNKSL